MVNYLFYYFFQQSYNLKTDCTCHLGNETLGCLARNDIVCPEIDSFDVRIECGLLFCTCFDREPETFHCLDTNDCPIRRSTTRTPMTTSTTTTPMTTSTTTTPMTTSTTTTPMTTSNTSPPMTTSTTVSSTTTPEDDCTYANE